MEKQRLFEILRHTAPIRIWKLILIGVINVLLIILLILFIILYSVQVGKPTGCECSSTISTPIVKTSPKTLSSTPDVTSPAPTVTAATTTPTSTTTTTTTTATTGTDNILCTPTTPTTFLFAYSNDLSSYGVSRAWHSLARTNISSHFSTFANIRFDVIQEDDIQYHSNWKDVNASIQSHLPNSSLSFCDPDIGSDVLKMIEKFLDNSQAPICGSMICILVKRYPNEIEIDGLVTKLRQNHVTFTVLYVHIPIGGQHPETLYNLATKTNGLCIIDENSDAFVDDLWVLDPCANPYLMYAANPQVSGEGNISLPLMTVPIDDNYWIMLTVLDRGPIGWLRLHQPTVKLTWSVIGSSDSSFLAVEPSIHNGYFSGNYLASVAHLNQTSYSMTLNYKYSDNIVQTLQIRVYSNKPVNYWIPYDK